MDPRDDAGRREEALPSIVPRDRQRVYDMRVLIELVLDVESFFEIGEFFGPSLITGLGRVDGVPVGVMANDPACSAGAIDADAAEKMTRLVDLCDSFCLPIVNFVDNPGFLVGVEAEMRGTIRKGVRALAAVFQATTPWCSIIVRKAFGVAGAGHSNHVRANPRYAWGIDIGNRALKAIKLVRDGDNLRMDDVEVIEHEQVLSNSGDNRETLIQTAERVRTHGRLLF